jgi:hypothetical protein
MKTEVATFESVWAAFRETQRRQEETAKQLQESRAKFDREMQASREDFDRERKASNEDFDRRMKKIDKTLGGWASNQGAFAEEYFINSFERGQKNFFGEKFDDVSNHLKNRWQGIEDEYDIVLYNHTSVALIEVKYKAHVNDVPDVLKKAETFRILFPNYKDFKIYLGLASMSFYSELEEECIKNGIAVIKQVGDTVVINDENLKVF